MKGLTIKELAKKLNMTYQQARYYVRRLNAAGMIKPLRIRGRETEWDISTQTRKALGEVRS